MIVDMGLHECADGAGIPMGAFRSVVQGATLKATSIVHSRLYYLMPKGCSCVF